MQRVIHNDLKMFLYKVQILQKQTDVNKRDQVEFCQSTSERIESNPGVFDLILLSDEVHFSPGAQRHLFHISSTKGLTPGMGRTVLRDPQTAFLKFRKCGLPLEGTTRSTPKIRFNSHLEYIHQTCAKMFSLGV